MEKRQATLRLNILGRLPDDKAPPETLTILASFERAQAVSSIEFDSSQAEDLRQTIRDLRGFVKGGYPPFDEPSLRALGTTLFELIIRDDVKRLFDKASTQFSENEDQAFLALEILALDKRIAGWPWEYLFDATSDLFICQEFNPISRGIITLTPGNAASTKSKIRVLVVLGSLPTDTEATPPMGQVKAIYEALNSHLATDSVELAVMAGNGDRLGVEPGQLQREIQRKSYDIVHFYGHAGFDHVSGQGYLRLDQEDGSSFRLTANQFATMLAGRGVRVVFLNACETAKADESDAPVRSSLAAALLGRAIPAVIATQFEMPAGSADHFAALTYDALALGLPIGEATRAGRQAMNWGPSVHFYDWGIPVLFTSDPNLRIFPRPDDQPPPAWKAGFEEAINTPDLIAKLGTPNVPGGPAVTVERTVRSLEQQKSRAKIALVDIDAGVGYLPELVEAANRAQEYYGFQIAYLPIPSGAIRTDIADGQAGPQLFLPLLEDCLDAVPQRLNVQMVCFLTSKMLAGKTQDGTLFWNYFASSLSSNRNVFIISTHGLREYANQAQVSFTKAAFYLCLSEIVAEGGDERMPFHDETAGCLLDYCKNRWDLVVGLRRMRFDHAVCRSKIRDPERLEAIDKLLTSDVDVGAEQNLTTLETRHRQYDVYDSHGEKLGKVDDLFVGADHRPKYLGVEVTPEERLPLIPMEVATSVDHEKGIIEISEEKSRVVDGPAFEHVAEITPAKQKQVSDYYGLMQPQPSPVLEAQEPYYFDSAGPDVSS